MADIEVAGLVAKIALDDTGVNKSMAELSRSMKLAQSEFQAAGAKLGDFGKSTDGLKVKAESLTKQIGIQQQMVDKLRAEHAKAAAEKGEDAKQTQNLAVKLNNAEAQLARMTNELKSTNAEITRQSSAWTKMSDALKPVGDQMQAAGKKMTDAGKTLSVAVTAPITAMGASIIRTGMEFEAAMSKVAAISGATGDDLKAMTDQAKELGATTVFSASQAASGMEFLARAGWDAQEIMAAMPGMLDLAASGALDLGEAADITSNIMSAFGIEAAKAGNVADILAVANANANTNVQQLGQAMTYLAPTAATMGQAIEQATAAVMIMSDAGIQGEKAGAAFATSLQRLAKPTREMENTMRDLGITFFDSQGVMKPMTQIVAELEKATAGYTNEQKAAALSTIFGAEAYKNWAVLVETGSEALARNVEMLENADGAAKAMADTMMDNAKGTWIEFKSAVEGLSIALSDHLLPIFSALVLKLTEWARWFGELDPAMQKVILAVAGIAAAIGPALVVIGALVQSAGTIITSFAAVSAAIVKAGGVMAVLTGPVGIAVAALAGLVAAGIAVYANWETIKEYGMRIWDSISAYVMPVVDAIAVFIQDTFEDLAEWWRQIWPDLKDAFVNIWTGISFVVGPILDGIVAIFQATWPYIQNIVVAVWDVIKTVTRTTLDILTSLVNVFAALFTGNWSMLWNNIKNILSSAWEAFGAIVNGATKIILNIIGGLIASIVAYFENLARNMVTYGNNMVQGLGQGILNMTGWIKEKVLVFVTSIADTIKGFFGIHSPSTLLAEYGRYLVEGLWQGIQSMIGWITEKVTSFSSGVADAIKQFFGIASPSKLMTEYGVFIAQGLGEGIKAASSVAISAATSMANGVIGAVNSALSALNQLTGGSLQVPTISGPKYGSDGYPVGMPDWLKPKTGTGGSEDAKPDRGRNPYDKNDKDYGSDGRYVWDEKAGRWWDNEDGMWEGGGTNPGGVGQDSRYKEVKEREKREREVRDKVKDVVDKVKDTIKDVFDRIPGLATGGTVLRGGLTLVGEKGPELLNLPRGSQVVPNYELPNIGGAAIDYDALAQAMARVIKPSVTQYNSFYSPKALTPSETARRNQQALRQMGLEWGWN